MPGMGSGLQTNNPIIVRAFHDLLQRQALIVLLLVAFLAVGWNLLRAAQLRKQTTPNSTSVAEHASSAAGPEPSARHLLRVCFGFLWIFDGLLQIQASMPLGMTTQVIQPSAATSPSWVQHLVNAGGTIWSNHPITAPASAVWIQLGLGVWLLVAPRGNWSRLGGVSSAMWGLVVWVFGESFGGIFAPGLSWTFGAPGAALFYVIAGLLIALPDRAWASRVLGRAILSATGLFFVGMAVLQAWPGRGFWQGRVSRHTAPGTLAAMVAQMARTPQPRSLSLWVASFGSFDAAHGWAVNLFLVVCLAALGIAFLGGDTKWLRVAVLAATVFCLADWVLIEDFGFLGGVGTDPNSMIPMLLVIGAGYIALTRTADAEVNVFEPATVARSQTLVARLTARPAYTFRVLAALCAIGITLIGAAPMAVASTEPNADPIVSQAIDGTPNAVNYPAPPFRLTDQFGHVVSLQSLRGKAVALTFLDPVCVSDCPIIAQELRATAGMLGPDARRVELVAVVANPVYRSGSYLVAFDRQEGLQRLSNWAFLTGSTAQLQRVWDSFGILVADSTGGAMVAHSDIAYVIDPKGHARFIIDSDPGPGTQVTKSSFSGVLASAIRSALAR